MKSRLNLLLLVFSVWKKPLLTLERMNLSKSPPSGSESESESSIRTREEELRETLRRIDPYKEATISAIVLFNLSFILLNLSA
jgi:hypothetical protein